MEAIITAIRKIIEHGIISYVNTKDRALDSLIVTLLLTFIGTLFYYIPTDAKAVKNFFRRKVTLENVKELYPNIDDYITSDYTIYTWGVDWDDKTHQGYKLIVSIYNRCAHKAKNEKINIVNKTVILKLQDISLDHLTEFLSTEGNHYPIYMSTKGNIVFLSKNTAFKGVGLNCKSLEEFHETVDHLISRYYKEELEEEEEKKEKEVRKIILQSEDISASLHPDRTFDLIVTRHKEDIFQMIKSFQQAQSGKSSFNGFGTHNLGLMLYGKPGTGKTSLIKATANYLGRDIYMVDMKEVKTCKDFKSIFYSSRYPYKKHVIVLEEIDCIPGVLSRRNADSQNTDISEIRNEKKELNDRYIQILSCQANCKDEKVAVGYEIEKTEIKQQLKKLNERLTLDTILTVLDGTVEMRGRVIIATTNYIDRLDEALIRDGRFDLKIELTAFNHEECQELLFKMFTGIASEEDIAYMKSRKFRENEFAPAQILAMVQKHRNLRKVVEIMAVADK